MEFGRHLRELSRQRLALAMCVALAAIAALSVSYKVSLLPPSLEPRSLEMASATTEMLVDGPMSTVLDLRQGAGDIEEMTNRAVLIGNVMVSEPVLAFIGRRAGIPPSAIRGQAPLTPDFPRPLSGDNRDPETADLLRSTDQHRLNIQTNPAVPFIEIFAQAPTAKAAQTLANASVDGLRDYLAHVARRQGTPPDAQVTLTQLGRARGTVVNGGIRSQLAILAFFVVLSLATATAVFVERVRRGWRDAAESERDDEDQHGPRPAAPATRAPGATQGSPVAP